MSDPLLCIDVLRNDEAVIFAAQELQRYCHLMGLEGVEVREGCGNPVDCWRIELGLFSDFGFPLPEGTVADLNDRLRVDLTSAPGIIAGSNPRSVLLAVYRLLERAGCRFIRPGKDGEIIPRINQVDLRIKFEESPAYRHRGMCIEGAVSLEHVLDSVDWAPKAGLNAYFLEFMVPFTFFDRWYRHLLNPSLQPEPVSVEQVVDFRIKIEAEIQRRGLAYHNPGHGWTCEPLGVRGLGWDTASYALPPDLTQYLAEVNGVRGIYKGIPLNTHLCYSNAAARKMVVEYAVQYVFDHPEIDYLHVWLADEVNNICECAKCRESLPSDQYVTLLNELDEAFTAHQIQCRIVFIAYLDLLWSPKTQKFNHPGRFVLLFAPISRSYSRSYDLETTDLVMPEYIRNDNRMPSELRENLVFLKAWKEHFAGDSFTYEYYFMWDHYLDPGYMQTAKVLHEDIHMLRSIGLNGIMSDQTQRAYFPTGFGMHVMARSLWDPALDFEEIAANYFLSDFGEDGALVQTYLSQLSELFDPPYLRGESDKTDGTSHVWVLNSADATINLHAAHNLAQIPTLVDQFRLIIERNLADVNPCRARSWHYLAQHAEVVVLLAQAFEARALGRKEKAREYWQSARSYVQQHELDLQNVLDVYEFITVLGARFPETE